MDGFEDLLPSGFEDPFAQPRSKSPDPWSTFSNPVESDPYGSTGFAEFNEEARDTTPTTESYIKDTPELSLDIPTDPLESTSTSESPDEARPSAGFREAPVFSEIATIRPTGPEELEPSVPSPHEKLDSAASSLSSSFRRSPDVSPSNSVFKSEPSVSSPGPLASSPPPVEHTFPNLSLGGETGGGWQSASTSSAWGGTADEDSDDDKPIMQTIRARQDAHLITEPRSPTESVSPPRAANGEQPTFVISVEDPQKVGDPIRSFTMYTVHTRTTSTLFQKSSFSVLRRYSDFLWLYETLTINCPGVVVPPVPEKNSFGRFDDQFVQQRRMALEKCIQKIANHPILGKDADFKVFIESDSFALDIKHRKAELANERGGIMASLGQTLAGPRFHENDEWFDRQRSYLDSLEAQLRSLVKSIELVARHRADLAVATGEFAQSVTDLASSEVGKQLSHSLNALSEVERQAQELQNSQARQDVDTLLSTVDEYARLINSVRLAFTSRVRTYHAWQSADGDVRRVKSTHEKARAQGRIPQERLGHALSQIAEAERRAVEARHEFENVSKLIKTEVARFESERVEDFKDSLQAFLEGMIQKQRQLIGGWENYQGSLLQKTVAK